MNATQFDWRNIPSRSLATYCNQRSKKMSLGQCLYAFGSHLKPTTARKDTSAAQHPIVLFFQLSDASVSSFHSLICRQNRVKQKMRVDTMHYSKILFHHPIQMYCRTYNQKAHDLHAWQLQTHQLGQKKKRGLCYCVAIPATIFWFPPILNWQFGLVNYSWDSHICSET